MVIGGQAVLIYGEPRLTKDIDITLGLSPKEFEKVKRINEKLKLKILVEDAETFVKKTMVLPSLDEKSGIRIDFIFSFSSYESQAIERAKNVRFGNSSVKVASLEDVVVHKLIAGRPRDIEDVKSVLLKNPEYDSRYITKWLKEFDKSEKGSFLKVFKEILRDIK